MIYVFMIYVFPEIDKAR